MPEQVADVTVQETLNQKPEAEGADSETAQDSSTEKTEGQDATGEVEKTAEGEEASAEGSDDGAAEKGQPIPYERFKKINEERNAFKKQIDTVSAELDEVRNILKDPSTVRAILQAKGYRGKDLVDAMANAGIVEEQPEDELFKGFIQGLDLTKQENWLKVMAKMAQHYSGNAVKPIADKLSEKDASVLIQSLETEAQSLAKEVYKIEYGKAGKDEENPKTAVGKIWAYLQNHPDDAKLGHVKLLRLAMSEEGFKLGKEQGKKEEKDRTGALKRSQMEGDGQGGKDETPNADWSNEKIIEWRHKHEKE